MNRPSHLLIAVAPGAEPVERGPIEFSRLGRRSSVEARLAPLPTPPAP